MNNLTETAVMEEMDSAVLTMARNVEGAADISDAARERTDADAHIVLQGGQHTEMQRQSLNLKGGMAELDAYAKAISRIMAIIGCCGLGKPAGPSCSH